MAAEAPEEPVPDDRAVQLPRADEAEIDSSKLYGYALNPNHPLGRHKARVFNAALFIERCDWQYLEKQILAAVSSGEVVGVDETDYGTQYRVRLLIEGLNNEVLPVMTIWMVRDNDVPRLVTTYVDV